MRFGGRKPQFVEGITFGVFWSAWARNCCCPTLRGGMKRWVDKNIEWIPCEMPKGMFGQLMDIAKNPEGALRAGAGLSKPGASMRQSAKSIEVKVEKASKVVEKPLVSDPEVTIKQLQFAEDQLEKLRKRAASGETGLEGDFKRYEAMRDKAMGHVV